MSADTEIRFKFARVGDEIRFSDTPERARTIAYIDPNDGWAFYVNADGDTCGLDMNAIADLGGVIVRRQADTWSPVDPADLEPGDRARAELAGGLAVEGPVTAVSGTHVELDLRRVGAGISSILIGDAAWYRLRERADS